jgi:two-component system, NtrC family, sensor histidine kinase KinB
MVNFQQTDCCSLGAAPVAQARALDTPPPSTRHEQSEPAELLEQTRVINERLVLSSVREQENAEAADHQRAQLNALLENLSDGVIIADPSGRILLANRAAHDVWLGERTIADVHELNLLETRFIDGRPYPSDERPLMRALRGETFERCELLRVRADGDIRRLVTNGTNVRDAKGNVELAIVVFRDVTDLRRLEQQRDEYTALISHDLRGPLNSILLSASTLMRFMKANKSFEDTSIIERLARNAQRMNKMLVELVESLTLESAGIELSKEPCDLGKLVAGIIDDLDDANRQRVLFEAGPDQTCVLAEPSKLERAITNLVTNALKYSPENADVRVTITRKGENVVLEVVDRGIGIAAVHLPRLFERYYRAPSGSRVSGLGLGLYITGLIVRAHGGRIEVASEVGEGSSFRLFLPLLVVRS